MIKHEAGSRKLLIFSYQLFIGHPSGLSIKEIHRALMAALARMLYHFPIQSCWISAHQNSA